MLSTLASASAGALLPLQYVEPVFRPPAEARSFILQATIGCSWNQCTFCEMYTAPQQQYRMRPLDEIESDLRFVANARVPVTRVFLADGDALNLPTKRLRAILELIREHLPGVKRVGSYCLPRNVRNKEVEELSELRELGLRTLYVGCESGDDEVLRRVGKGETLETSVAALTKLKAAGLRTSVMILHGLGGTALSEQHARNSAALIKAAPPTYLSTLVVSFPRGEEKVAAGFADLPEGFEPLTDVEVVDEMHAFMSELELPPDAKTIFRSNHASNYLNLEGNLPRDRPRLLAELEQAQRGEVRLRPEWSRGL